MREEIIVANREYVKIFYKASHSAPLEERKVYHNASGRKKNRELETDKPGRSIEQGGTKHALSTEQEAREHLLERFIGEVALEVESEAASDGVDSVTLIAEPHTLGVFKRLLGPRSKARIKATVAKDLYFAGPEEVTALQVNKLLGI